MPNFASLEKSTGENLISERTLQTCLKISQLRIQGWLMPQHQICQIKQLGQQYAGGN